MTYNPRNLSVLCYADGWTQWFYWTQEDDVGDILKTNHFQGEERIAAGDWISVVTCGGRGPKRGFLPPIDGALIQIIRKDDVVGTRRIR